MLALLAPGQGAQTPGLLRPWLDVAGVEARLRWLSVIAGIDLIEIGTEAGADTIRDTAIAQPLIVAAGIVAAEHLDLPADGIVYAGHSVGEFTASVLAGALEPEAGLALTAARGRAMADAAGRVATGMTAVIGGDPDEVTAHLEAAGLTAANRNGAGQIVAAGTVEALAALKENPPPGARVRPLAVAGAFHTTFMGPGRDALALLGPGLRPRDPGARLLSNADGHVVTSGSDLVGRLVEQVAAPVRWDLCLATLRDLGVTGVLELPPAGTLTGIARRELPGVPAVALKTPDDLPAARELIAEHAVRPLAGARS